MLCPPKSKTKPQKPAERGAYGSLKGTFVMREDFDEPLEDFQLGLAPKEQKLLATFEAGEMHSDFSPERKAELEQAAKETLKQMQSK